MDRKHVGSSTVGGSSLLVIFAVLALTVFALLSLSTARAGERLSTTSADAVSAYYQADCRAEEILARLRSGELPDGVTAADNIYSYTCAISDTQALEVSVQLENGLYTILRWQSVSTTDWQPDDTLNLWDGDPQ